MLRVIIVEVPGGDESRAKEIDHVDIWNVSELAPVSDYRWEAHRDGERGEVVGHRREDGWQPLVARVLAGLMKGNADG